MNPYVFEFFHFDKATVSPVDNKEHNSDSIVLFVSQLDKDTGDSVFLLSKDLFLDNGNFVFVHNFSISDQNYMLNVGFNEEGYFCNFDYPHYCHIDLSVFNYLGGLFSVNSSDSFFESLNGKYGSFPDGSIVTVSGKMGDFTVKSSEIFWNDDDKKNFMLIYILFDSSGRLLISPDIHVSLKV